MQVLSMEECSTVAGAESCDYMSPQSMFTNAGMAGATAGAIGFFGGPAVSGIASAGVAAGALLSFGVYNAVIFSFDFFGGCDGYFAC